eukprot:XP_003727032.1 PREDICTED: transmembrane protein 70, mitochondrial-like [Strongylocentrotus purpuratus]
MSGLSIVFKKVEGVGLPQLLKLILRPHVVRAPTIMARRVITLRSCFSSSASAPGIGIRRDYMTSSDNLLESIQYSKLVHPGTRRKISTSCNPLKVELKEEQNGDTLIYNGPLTKMVCLVKFFSLSTSIVSTGLITTLVLSSEVGAMTYIAGGISSLMIFTPIILHWFTKGYVAKMYHNHTSQTYTACTFNFFLRDVKTEFKRSDVSLPAVTNAISSFSIRDKAVLVDPRGFINPNHYSHLMGYTDTDGNVNFEKQSNSEELR